MMTTMSEAPQKGLSGVGVPKKAPANGKAGAKATFSFKKPAVPKFSVMLTPTARAQAQAEFAEFQAEIRREMTAFVGLVREIDGMPAEEAGLYSEQYRQSQNAIAEMLGYEHDAAREFAVLIYAQAMVSTCPATRYDVEGTVEALTSAGFLVETRKGGVRVYDNIYALAEAFARNGEAKATLSALSNLVASARQAGRERFAAELAELTAQAGETPLTVAELKSGKEGRMVLHIPDTKSGDGTRTYKGGYLLLTSVSKKITIISAIGAITRKAMELAEAQTFVWADQIGREKLVSAKPLPHEVFDRMLVLWHWLGNACAAGEAAEKATAEAAELEALVASDKTALEAVATLTPEEFFLGGQAGTAVLDLSPNEPWVRKTPEGKEEVFPGVVALVERNEAGEIRVADCPERLVPLFAGNREFLPAGEKFANLGELRPMLRTAFAMVVAQHNAAMRAAKPADPRAEATAEQAARLGVNLN